jgi:SAM-dependent methyltransferase
MFRFLDLSLKNVSIYPEILKRLKSGETFLDLGCCFGQEIRQLVYDGAPAAELYGSDLRPKFIDLGFDLFKDKDTLKSTFIPADVFDDKSELLTRLSGKLNIVYTGSFFHLFGLEEQKAVARQVVKLLSSAPGGLIIGRQVGNIDGRAFESGDNVGGEQNRFRHNADTWKEFWDLIGKETNTKWEVDAELHNIWMNEGPEERLSKIREEEGVRLLKFVVKKL